MLIKEFRIIMPMSVQDYQIAQLWSVAEASRNETGGGEGVEIMCNEPFNKENHVPSPPLLDGEERFTSGQFTYKIYHVDRKVSSVMRVLAPKGSLKIEERAWNAYPYCRTVVNNPSYMKENMEVIIESMHFGDNGSEHNIHRLSADILKDREVIFIDIANDPIEPKHYKKEYDPKLFKPTKGGIGPLVDQPWWKNHKAPIMCCYKLVRCEFKWWGLQSKIEKLIQKEERKIFFEFHRMVYCWMDKWSGWTIEQVRKFERETKEELSKNLHVGEKRGHLENE